MNGIPCWTILFILSYKRTGRCLIICLATHGRLSAPRESEWITSTEYRSFSQLKINMKVNETEVRLLSTHRTHKLKPFHHRPGKPITLQEVEVSRISGMSAHKGSKFDSPRHRPPLPHRKHPCYSFLLEGYSTLVILGRVGHRAARRIKYVEF